MNRINPHHSRQRTFLRILGPLILLVGIAFTVVGMVSFFSTVGDFGSHSFGPEFGHSGVGAPDRFWCVFVGLPVSFVGLALCYLAFMGKVARYTSGELAPVGKDTFNYLAHETQEGMADISEAIYTGRSRRQVGSIEERIRKLETMRDSGLINADDFEEQKDRILSEI